MSSLTMLLHGNSKVGKSTLAATAPFPICLFDAEGSTKFLRLRFKPWDPVKEPPPVYDGTWDVARVIVRTLQDVVAGYDWLNSGQHHFRSVVVDSITEVQRKLRNQIAGSDKMEWSHYDEMLRRLDVLIMEIRDLTQHQLNPLLTSIMVCESKIDTNTKKMKPNLQGGIAPMVPYRFDLVGYLWVEQLRDANLIPVRDENGKIVKVRRLGISADEPSYEAGERVQGLLPDIVDNPNISEMLVTVFPELAQPN